MAHADEHTLEMMVLEPGRVAAAERATVMAHIADCAGCRAVHEDLIALHRDLRESAASRAMAVDDAMRKIFASPGVIHLVPYRPHLQVPVGASYSGILAAMAPETVSHEGFETVATFASEADHILLRVRQDATGHRVKLYYHADDPSRQCGPMVTLPALEADAVIDDQGRAEFPIAAPKSPREWSHLEALVTFPVCSLVRGEDHTVTVEEKPQPSGAYHIECRQDGPTIELRSGQDPGMSEIRRAVVWLPDGRSVLVRMSAGTCSFTDPAPQKKLVIRLYT